MLFVRICRLLSGTVSVSRVFPRWVTNRVYVTNRRLCLHHPTLVQIIMNIFTMPSQFVSLTADDTGAWWRCSVFDTHFNLALQHTPILWPLLVYQILDSPHALINVCYCNLIYQSPCQGHRDYCENCFWDLHTIVAIHNDTAVAFTWPSHESDTNAWELPGYGLFADIQLFAAAWPQIQQPGLIFWWSAAGRGVWPALGGRLSSERPPQWSRVTNSEVPAWVKNTQVILVDANALSQLAYCVTFAAHIRASYQVHCEASGLLLWKGFFCAQCCSLSRVKKATGRNPGALARTLKAQKIRATCSAHEVHKSGESVEKKPTFLLSHI